jgi:hypothetical protein
VTSPPPLTTLLRSGWSVSNYRGQLVSRLEGPAFAALAAAAAVAAGAPPKPVVCAASGALLAGRIDDVWGSGAARGLRGHAEALRRGRLTTGSAKVVLLAGAGALTALSARPYTNSLASPALMSAADTATLAGCVALGANLVNLFDLRPGRALKVVLAAGLPRAATGSAGGAVLAGVASAAMACLPVDLAERAMLGDAGANPAGALTGLGLALSAGPQGRRRILGGLLALTLASEAVSFSRILQSVPPLRWLDELGRRDPA